MIALANDPKPVLVAGAVYWGDNGRRVCRRCAGMSALYTVCDVSGQRVERVTARQVAEWQKRYGRLACEAGCTTLSPIAGPDGWPLAEGGA